MHGSPHTLCSVTIVHNNSVFVSTSTFSRLVQVCVSVCPTSKTQSEGEISRMLFVTWKTCVFLGVMDALGPFVF